MTSEETIGDVLKRRLVKHGLLNNFLSSRICKVADEVGQGDYETVSFKRGVLKVAVSSAGRGQMVKFQEKMLIKKINEVLKEDKVHRLIIEVGLRPPQG